MSMLLIKIISCTDPSAWYSSLVGKTVVAERFEPKRDPSQGIPEDVYWVREGGTYNPINWVRASDVSALEPAPNTSAAFIRAQVDFLTAERERLRDALAVAQRALRGAPETLAEAVAVIRAIAKANNSGVSMVGAYGIALTRVQAVEAERDQLRAEVERLTRQAEYVQRQQLEPAIARADRAEAAQATLQSEINRLRDDTCAQTINQLRAALAAAQEDSKRLDWLDEHRASIDVNEEETLSCRVQSSDDFEHHGFSIPYAVRDAIDAARNPEERT